MARGIFEGASKKNLVVFLFGDVVNHSFFFFFFEKHAMFLLHQYILDKIQKHFQNVMLVGMASKISKNYTYKFVDRSRHNGIKGTKAKCAH